MTETSAQTTDTPSSSSTPTEVEVKIGDKAVKVSPDVAAALQAAQAQAAEAGAAVTRLTTALSEKEAALAAAAAPAPRPTQKGEESLDVMLFTDPDRAIQKITEGILQKVEQKQMQTSAQAQYWEEFYKANPDLKDMDGYTRFVFAQEFATMKKDGLTVEQSIKRVGDRVRADALKLAGGKREKQKPVGEGGNEGNSRQQNGSDGSESNNEPTMTTGQVLRERQEARRAAKQPGRRSK